MSNRLKMSFALVIATLLLGGCTPLPDDFPPLAHCAMTVTASTA